MGFPKRKKFRRFSTRQRDVSDCGPACLACICASYGLYVAVSRIRQMAGTDRHGSSVLGMVEAAIQLGFDAKGVRTDYESLALDIMPAIVHVVINERTSHFIVAEKITDGWVAIMDPAEGRARKISRNQFTSMWTGVVILLSPNGKFKPNARASTLTRIISLAEPYSRQLAIATICAVLVSVIGLTHSYYIKEIIDQVLPRNELLLLNVLSLTILTTLVIQYVAAMVKSRFVLKVSRHINASLVMNYYGHVMHLSKQFFDSMRTGEIVSRISDVVRISAFINEIVVHLVIDLLIIAFSLAFMLMYNWQIALIVLAVVPLYIFMYLLSRRINRQWQRKIMESTADFEAQVVESISTATTIKYLALEKHFISQARTRLQKMLMNVYAFSLKQLSVEQSADFITRVFTLVLLWSGSYFVIKGKLTTGELVSFYSLLSLFTVPVLNLINFSRSYGEAKVAAERVFEILDLKTMESGSKRLRFLPRRAFTIKFENVKFRYGNNVPVLQNVNLEIGSGSITGIKGKSGSGKSTLAALLLRSFEPEAGTIWINETSLAEVSRESLTEIISIAHQQADLFTGTIAENIMIGREVNQPRLDEISERLGIAEFADKLSDGLNTHVSEYGGNLSGGQRQRISIARALYRNSPVLILDEATSAVDAVSEEKIMQTIEWYKNNGNTVVIIAHSDSTLKICDNIAVLDDGVIK